MDNTQKGYEKRFKEQYIECENVAGASSCFFFMVSISVYGKMPISIRRRRIFCELLNLGFIVPDLFLIFETLNRIASTIFTTFWAIWDILSR